MVVGDRTGNHIREEGDITTVADEIVTKTSFAINIRKPGELHKRIKTDSDGDQ